MFSPVHVILPHCSCVFVTQALYKLLLLLLLLLLYNLVCFIKTLEHCWTELYWSNKSLDSKKKNEIPLWAEVLRFWGTGHRAGICGTGCGWSLLTAACEDSVLGSGWGLTFELRQRANPRMMGRQREALAQTKTLCHAFLREGTAEGRTQIKNALMQTHAHPNTHWHTFNHYVWFYIPAVTFSNVRCPRPISPLSHLTLHA